MMRPRVGYDARFAMNQCRGMGHYLRQLISDYQQEFQGFCATGERGADLNLSSKGFHSHPLWEQVSLPRRIREENIDIFLAPFNTAPLYLPRRVKLIVVVHDLIFFEPLPRSASSYQNAGRLYRQLIVPRAVQRAELVITVSHFVASQLRDRFNIKRDKLVIIPNTIDSDWYRDVSGPDARDNYVLLVSGEAPSKNLSTALEACARSQEFRNRGCSIKILGVKEKYHNIFQEQAKRLGIAQIVELMGFVPRFELQQLYRHALVFLMPSLSEGFGIPLVEAMASGTPVVASNTSCLPEIAGEAARYFDPRLPKDIADSLDQVLLSATLRDKMQKVGYERARQYHPENIRKQIHHFWASLLT